MTRGPAIWGNDDMTRAPYAPYTNAAHSQFSLPSVLPARATPLRSTGGKERLRTLFTNKGESIICDPSDYEFLSGFVWHLARGYPTTKPPLWRKTITMHRLLLNPPEGFEVDHINRIRADNRRSNLRICSTSQNAANKKCRLGKSGFRGVHATWFQYLTPRFRATVEVKGKRIHGPTRRSAQEAAVDYDRMALAHFGEFATLNFPQGGL